MKQILLALILPLVGCSVPISNAGQAVIYHAQSHASAEGMKNEQIQRNSFWSGNSP